MISDKIRTKIYENAYWKEECVGLCVETLKEKVTKIDHFGGTYGHNDEPTPFLCLLLKMLHIQPSMPIVHSFLHHNHSKYVRLLGAFYLRLMGISDDVYCSLEPLCKDNEELRQISHDGRITSTRVNDVIDDLLKKNYFCDITLPLIIKRLDHEDTCSLKHKESSITDYSEEMKKPDDLMDVFEQIAAFISAAEL